MKPVLTEPTASEGWPGWLAVEQEARVDRGGKRESERGEAA